MINLRQSVATCVEQFWPGRIITSISKLRYAYKIFLFLKYKDIFDCICEHIKSFHDKIVTIVDSSKCHKYWVFSVPFYSNKNSD